MFTGNVSESPGSGTLVLGMAIWSKEMCLKVHTLQIYNLCTNEVKNYRPHSVNSCVISYFNNSFAPEDEPVVDRNVTLSLKWSRYWGNLPRNQPKYSQVTYQCS